MTWPGSLDSFSFSLRCVLALFSSHLATALVFPPSLVLPYLRPATPHLAFFRRRFFYGFCAGQDTSFLTLLAVIINVSKGVY